MPKICDECSIKAATPGRIIYVNGPKMTIKQYCSACREKRFKGKNAKTTNNDNSDDSSFRRTRNL